jgi:hypothetical protein
LKKIKEGLWGHFAVCVCVYSPTSFVFYANSVVSMENRRKLFFQNIFLITFFQLRHYFKFAHALLG